MAKVISWSVCSGGEHYTVHYDDGSADVFDVRSQVLPDGVGAVDIREELKSESIEDFEQKLELLKISQEEVKK